MSSHASKQRSYLPCCLHFSFQLSLPFGQLCLHLFVVLNLLGHCTPRNMVSLRGSQDALWILHAANPHETDVPDTVSLARTWCCSGYFYWNCIQLPTATDKSLAESRKLGNGTLTQRKACYTSKAAHPANGNSLKPLAGAILLHHCSFASHPTTNETAGLLLQRLVTAPPHVETAALSNDGTKLVSLPTQLDRFCFKTF